MKTPRFKLKHQLTDEQLKRITKYVNIMLSTAPEGTFPNQVGQDIYTLIRSYKGLLCMVGQCRDMLKEANSRGCRQSTKSWAEIYRRERRIG